MKKKNNFRFLVYLMLLGLIPLFSTESWAHLCDDVFLQAKDNLAVKVDVRDGQLRIAKQGKFRVYVLNTMDRRIENINLKVETDDFDVNVKPGWWGFPILAQNSKEYFEVTLKRKKNVTAGKYKIGLKLVNGEDSKMIFKSVNINDAMDVIVVPKAKGNVLIDGNASKSEWGKSSLCTSLYQIKIKPANLGSLKKHNVNQTANVQTRFRFQYDNNFLYCFIDFIKPGKDNVATIYISESVEKSPEEIEIDLADKDLDSDIKGTIVKFNGTKAELKIPLKNIPGKNKKSFFVNLIREHDDVTSYWRGNRYSCKQSMVFARFLLK